MVPWSTPREWQEAVRWVHYSIKRHSGNFDQARSTTCCIRQHLDTLDPILDTLCKQTCPGCIDVCCSRATVWYDFKDILYLGLMEIDFPDYQVSRDADGSCSSSGLSGCLLIQSRV